MMRKLMLIVFAAAFFVFATTATASCPNDYQRVIDGNCVKVCDTNEFYTDDGECHLRDCGIGRSQTYHACMNICYGGQVWDLRTQGCTRASCNIFQYLDQNGNCTDMTCPTGYRWDDHHVLCLRNACPLGSTRNANENCVLACDANEYYDSSTEECRPQCDESEDYDASDGQCHALCSAGSNWVNGACVLTPCEGGQQRIDGVCRCPDSQHLQNGACVNNQPECPAGQHYGEWPNEEGYMETVCVCTKENEIVQNGACIAVCNEGDYYLPSNHECHSTYCGPGRSQTYHACMNICPDDESWNVGSQKCVKPTSCSIHQYLQNGVCTDLKCPEGYRFDDLGIVCISNTCPVGRYRNSNGDCVECSAGQHLENGACVLTCAEGEHAENGACVADIPECLEGQHLENNACVDDVNEQVPDVNEQEEPVDNSFPVPFPVAELGNCASRSECEAYCNVPGNVVACLDFAEENDLLSTAEIAEARSIVQYIQAGTTPGHCASQQQCDTYCDKSENLQECVDFAVMAEIISQDEADMAIKTGGVGPGGCKREECQIYCEDESHFGECVDFAVANGLMDAKDAEMAKKTGGKGPAGCKKEECNTYCKEPAHQQECFQFAVENGIIPAENVEMMTACMQGSESCMSYCNASDERFASCVKMWESSGDGPSPEDIERMKANYYESPGGCKGNMACVQQYCSDPSGQHAIECEEFAVKNGNKTQEQFDEWKRNFDQQIEDAKPKEGPIDRPGCPPVQVEAMACYDSGKDAVLVTDEQGCMIMTGCQPKMNCPEGQHWENDGCMSNNPEEPEWVPQGCEMEAPQCGGGPPVCVGDHWECTAMPESSGGDQGFHCSEGQHLENGACVNNGPGPDQGPQPGPEPNPNPEPTPPTEPTPPAPQEPAPAPPAPEPSPPTGEVILENSLLDAIVQLFTGLLK